MLFSDILPIFIKAEECRIPTFFKIRQNYNKLYWDSNLAASTLNEPADSAKQRDVNITLDEQILAGITAY